MLAEYKTSVPFLRWFYPNDSKDLASAAKGRGFLPEILLALILFLSFNSWSQTTQSFGNLLIYLLWAVIVLLLFTLALTNAKTLLLPNALLKPLLITVIAFQILVAIQTNNASIIGSALLGALILGGIPYLLFQISAGRWIGGGDTKIGFIAGLLLGWKLSLFCLTAMVGLVALSFLVEYIAAKMVKGHTPLRLPTGVLWVTSIILSVLIGSQLLA
jgi:Flp pilus assembly protein protease CpaA